AHDLLSVPLLRFHAVAPSSTHSMPGLAVSSSCMSRVSRPMNSYPDLRSVSGISAARAGTAPSRNNATRLPTLGVIDIHFAKWPDASPAAELRQGRARGAFVRVPRRKRCAACSSLDRNFRSLADLEAVVAAPGEFKRAGLGCHRKEAHERIGR